MFSFICKKCLSLKRYVVELFVNCESILNFANDLFGSIKRKISLLALHRTAFLISSRLRMTSQKSVGQ